MDMAYNSTPWDPTLSEGLLPILSSFPALTKITLSARPNCVEWGFLPENFRMGFLDSLRLPAIKSVSIIWISSFPLSAFNGCNGVKDLTVEGWSLDDVNVIPDDTNRPLLESFSIRCCSGRALDRLITWAPARNLRTLELSRLYHPGDYGKALSKSFDFLTSLNLHLGPHFSDYSVYLASYVNAVMQPRYRDIPFTLHPLTRLERLTLCADLEFYSSAGTNHLGEGDDSTYIFMSSISALTCLVKAVSSLKHLTLAFHFCLDKRIHIPRASESICIPLVGLVNECHSPSVSLCVSATCYTDRDFDAMVLVVQN